MRFYPSESQVTLLNKILEISTNSLPDAEK